MTARRAVAARSRLRQSERAAQNAGAFMSRTLRIGVALAALILAAAVVLTRARAAAPEPESAEEKVRRCLEQLRAGEIAAARACFLPEALPANADEMLGQAHDALQFGDAPEVEVVYRGFIHTTGSGRSDRLVVHVRGAGKALLVFAQTRDVNTAPALVSLRWEPAPLDLGDRYPFRLAGVPPVYYALLGVAITVPILIVYAGISCFRERPRRRWLWLLFILFGLGRLSVVWVPGPLNLDNIRIQPLQFQLLGAGFGKFPIYEPWVLSVSIPLGALWYLSRRRPEPRTEPAEPAPGV